MTSHRTRFLPLGEFAPDAVEFDNPYLEVTDGLLPVYGGYRVIEKEVEQNYVVTDDNPVNMAHSHLVATDAPAQKQKPSGAADSAPTGNWVSEEHVAASAGNGYHFAKVNAETPDDSTYVRSTDNDTDIMRWVLAAPRRDPSAPANPDIVFRFRCRMRGEATASAHNIQYQLIDQGTLQVVVDENYVLTGGDAWEEEEHILTNGEIANITNWDDLEASFVIDSTAGGGSIDFESTSADKYRNGFKEDDGDETDVYVAAHMNATPATDSTYIESPAMTTGVSKTYICQVEDIEIPLDVNSATAIPFHASHATTGGASALTDVEYKLAQISDGAGDVSYDGVNYDVIATWTDTSIATDIATPTPDTISDNLTGAEWQTTDPAKLFFLIVRFTYNSGSAAITYLVPKSTITKYAGITGSHTKIDSCVGGDEGLASGGTGVLWPGDGTFNVFACGLGSSNPAGSADTGHTLHIYAKVDTGSLDTDPTVRLRQGSTNIKSWVASSTWRPTNSLAWYTATLSEAEAANITDYNDLNVRIEIVSNPEKYFIAEVYFEYPSDQASGRLYGVGFAAKPNDAFEISNAELESADPRNANVGDRTEIYAGTGLNLYSVEDPTWVNVTRTAADNYGDSGLTDIPQMWDFCSWGEDIIATNYADHVQVKQPADSRFSDLITSTDKPKARFCAAIASNLVLGNLNPSSYTGASAFQLWASAAMDPTYFHPTDYNNQSFLFSLVSQPGAVTGLVGGEYGVVFKRNSIWRMSYTGAPTFFRFDQIAIGQGCNYPQSIVQVDQDVYFWGSGGIFVVREGKALERLSQNRIEKTLFDPYESRSIEEDYTDDPLSNDSLVYGAYDAYSGLVWWFYKSGDDTLHKLTHYVVYNPASDRFTMGVDSTLDITTITGRRNVISNDTFLNRGILLFKFDDSGGAGSYRGEHYKLADTTTYTAQMKTKIVSSRSFGGADWVDMEIHDVRPVFKSDPSGSAPNFSITVEAAESPSMSTVQSRTMDRISEDLAGWMHLGSPVVGEYFRITLDIPELTDVQIDEIVGIECKVVQRGDH